ncbi:MAG: hypothetical protein EOM18_12405 [Clostridia bacterium]|nr:hypothetical protein [Clostridia bacterium]
MIHIDKESKGARSMNEREIIEQIWKEWTTLKGNLGRGTYGVVYQAERVILKKTYYTAIKIIKIPMKEKERIQKAEEEVGIMYQLRDSSCIVRIEDYHFVPVNEYDEMWLIIQMELMAKSMGDMLEEEGQSLNKEKAVDIMISLCRSLQEIHQSGIVHRDIKPDNILISPTGKYKFGDLGGAKYMDKTRAASSNFGTLDYAAPEILKKGATYNKTVDIYSLGLVFYTLLNKGENLPAIERWRCSEIPKPEDADEELWNIIKKACAFEKEERYQSADEMGNTLTQWKEMKTNKADKSSTDRNTSENIDYTDINVCMAEAQKGDSRAQFRVGYYYLNEADPVDEAEAARWYKKSADQGHMVAQSQLALLYEMGRGVEQSDQEAAKYYLKAARQGERTCQSVIGDMYEHGRGVEKNEKEAVYWYQQSAEQDYVIAQWQLADMLMDGRGVEKDENLAIYWYEKAADQGSHTALCQLGKLYDEGAVVPKDEKKAFSLYMQAARDGDKIAQRIVGERYLEGKGVDQSEEQAFVWYLKSAEAGNELAQCEVGGLYMKGVGTQKNYVEAIRWYKESAKQGNIRSQLMLGVIYETGIGTEKQDTIEALKWYQMAADQGDETAKGLVKHLCEKTR